MQASFGLGISFWTYLSMILNIAAFEVTGIQCPRYSGMRDFEMISVSFFEGLLFQGMITVMSCILFWYCKVILVSIGMALDNAELAGYLVRWLIPSIVMQAFDLQAITFCVSQGVHTPFGVSNFVSVAICSIICPFWCTGTGLEF